jgi:hypothetical protein
MSEPLDPLCVKHRDGWCMVRGKATDAMANVKTQCGMYVWFHHGLERRKPDCPECLRLLKARRAEEAKS